MKTRRVVLCLLFYLLTVWIKGVHQVFVAAISAFHSYVDHCSVGRHVLVLRFLWGVGRSHPSRPNWIPVWDLSLVLSAVSEPPFEPLQLKVLSLKVPLLLALVCSKRVGDLQALSMSTACLEFSRNDCMVRLTPRRGYVPKVLSTSFRA